MDLSSKYFFYVSNITKKVYIDEDGCFCVYYIKDDAEKTVRENSHIESSLLTRKFFNEVFSLGANEIKIFSVDCKECEKLENTNKNYTKFENKELSRTLLQLMETNKKKYLLELGKHTFIAPLKIQTRKYKQAPKIRYSYAKIDNDEQKYFLIFSDIKHFEQWKNNQMDDWKPVEITLQRFEWIRKGNPIWINPFSNNIRLKSEYLEIINKEVVEK